LSHIQKKISKSRRTGRVVNSWQARYTGPDGKERSRRFDRKVDAEAWLATNAADIARGDWIDPAASRVLFRDWAESWASIIVDLRPSTRQQNLDYLRRYILPTFGSLTVGQIDFTTIQTWVSTMTAEGPPAWWNTSVEPNRRTKPVAAATAVKAFQILNKIMATAVRSDRVRSNPCSGVKVPRIERKEMRFLTPSEIDILTDSIDERYQALILVAAYGGFRIGELAGLRRGRVDILNGRVDIAEVVVEVAGHLTYGEPKTRAGRRAVTLPRSVVGVLNDHLSQFTPADPQAFVFSAPEGGALRVPAWRRRFWCPAVTCAGLTPLRPHDLRHTAVALWVATGANPLEVSRRAGHASVSFTLDRYGHLFPEADQAVANRLDALMASGPRATLPRAASSGRPISDGRGTDTGSAASADVITFVTSEQDEQQWALRDSNPRPQPCEGCALTS
jgi:integrase